MARIFINHYNSDRELAGELAARLRPIYDKVVYVKTFRNEPNWWDQVCQRIARSDIVLTLLTKESINAHYTEAVLSEALRWRRPNVNLLADPNTPIPDNAPGPAFEITGKFKQSEMSALTDLIAEQIAASNPVDQPIWGVQTPRPNVSDAVDVPIDTSRRVDRLLVATVGFIALFMVLLFGVSQTFQNRAQRIAEGEVTPLTVPTITPAPTDPAAVADEGARRAPPSPTSGKLSPAQRLFAFNTATPTPSPDPDATQDTTNDNPVFLAEALTQVNLPSVTPSITPSATPQDAPARSPATLTATPIDPLAILDAPTDVPSAEIERVDLTRPTSAQASLEWSSEDVPLWIDLPAEGQVVLHPGSRVRFDNLLDDSRLELVVVLLEGTVTARNGAWLRVQVRPPDEALAVNGINAQLGVTALEGDQTRVWCFAGLCEVQVSQGTRLGLRSGQQFRFNPAQTSYALTQTEDIPPAERDAYEAACGACLR